MFFQIILLYDFYDLFFWNLINMKLKKLILSTILWIFVFISWVFAAELNFWDFLTIYFEWVSQWTENFWNGWRNIDVKYTNVKKGSELYKSLQKGIYLELFPNVEAALPIDEQLEQQYVAILLWASVWRNFSFEYWEHITPQWTRQMIQETLEDVDMNEMIKDDVIDQLKYNYLYSDEIDWDKNNCDTISGCMKLIDDEYTEYIDSNGAKDFMESLQWSFEWIWAYIQTISSGVFVISNTIRWWQAEKAWLKSGDIILKVDNHSVTKNTSINELGWYIKWKAGTFVKIQIQRWDKILDFNIQRVVVTLQNVSYKKLWWWSCYMKIEQFNGDTFIEFQKWLKFFKDNECEIYMFDLRDNPGGDLDAVVNMLNKFVPNGNVIVELRFNDWIQSIIADNTEKQKKDKYTMIFVNENSASASEIFAGVMDDYLNNAKLIGTKTYGKWSAQNVIEYSDWSILKYTIAKRYTWKSKKNIDWIWFEPDVKMSDEKINSFLEKLGLK